jgi:hypothetical protein
MHIFSGNSYRVCRHSDYTEKLDPISSQNLNDSENIGASYNSWWNTLDCFKMKRGKRSRKQASRSHHSCQQYLLAVDKGS